MQSGMSITANAINRQKDETICFTFLYTIFTTSSFLRIARRWTVQCIRRGAFSPMHSTVALQQAIQNTRRENAPDWTHLRLHVVLDLKCCSISVERRVALMLHCFVRGWRGRSALLRGLTLPISSRTMSASARSTAPTVFFTKAKILYHTLLQNCKGEFVVVKKI